MDSLNAGESKIDQLKQFLSNFTLNELSQSLSEIKQMIQIKQAPMKLSIYSSKRSPIENEHNKFGKSK
eukprot:gene27679-36433_t